MHVTDLEVTRFHQLAALDQTAHAKIFDFTQKSLRLALIICSAFLSLSCSVKYAVTPVDPIEAQTTRPGVYYMLPRTQLLAVLTISKSSVIKGKYAGDVWDICVDLCIQNEKENSSCPAARESSPVYSVESAKVFSRSVADHTRLYHVNVNFDTFAAFSDVFKLTNEGVLSSASTELENKSVEIAVNSAKSLAKLALAIAPAPPQPPNIMCTDFVKDFELQKRLDEATNRLQTRLDELLFQGGLPDGDAIENLISYTKDQMQALKSSGQFKDLVASRKTASQTESLGNYAALIEPLDYQASKTKSSDWKPIQSLELDGFAGLDATSAKQDEISNVKRQLEDQDVVVDVTSQVPFVHDCDSKSVTDTCPKSTNAGFRYRVPAAATVSISRKTPKDNREVLGAARLLVAQYGALVAMPSEVSGIKSKIFLDLYEGTGSPRQIDVGATPQPSTIVGDALSPVQDELDRRRQAKSEAEEKAEQAEISSLTKQRDILALKKEIKDLERELGNSDSH